MPPPLLCMKIFDKRIFLKQHQSVLQWNISVQWDKNFDRKSWYSPAPLIQTFSVPKISETLKDSPPTEIFGTVRQKIFDRKSWNSPLPLLSINFFATGYFLKHSTEVFTYQIFRHCETKNFERKVGIEYRNQWWNWCL